jgi:hypothetical protein
VSGPREVVQFGGSEARTGTTRGHGVGVGGLEGLEVGEVRCRGHVRSRRTRARGRARDGGDGARNGGKLPPFAPCRYVVFVLFLVSPVKRRWPSQRPRATHVAIIVPQWFFLVVRKIPSKIVNLVRVVLDNVAIALGHDVRRFQSTPTARVGELCRKVGGEKRRVQGVLTD